MTFLPYPPPRHQHHTAAAATLYKSLFHLIPTPGLLLPDSFFSTAKARRISRACAPPPPPWIGSPSPPTTWPLDSPNFPGQASKNQQPAMWFRKQESDIEMSGMMDGEQKKKKPSGPPEETEYQKFDWRRFFFAPKYIPWHILFIVIGILTVIITIKHDEVVEKLRPWSEKVRDLPAGWLIPIAILIVISFPPLFGHEVIALLCGVVYGLWIGFAIVAAGTFIGEVGTWYAFKYSFRNKAIKMERTNLNYGAMARLTRDGGFFIVLVIRLSAIPAHFSTAVFSTCDVKFWHFVLATFLSLPKQVFLVYLGVLLVQESNDDVIKTVMFGAIFVITIAMGVWIYMKMRTVKKILLEEQELRKVKKAEALELVPNVESAFERRYDEEPVQYTPMQPTQISRPVDRRYYEDAGEWAMQPTQPTRMI